MSHPVALALIVLAAACGTTSQPAGPGSAAGPSGSAAGSAVVPPVAPDAASAAADAAPTVVTAPAGEDCGALEDKTSTKAAKSRAEECFAAAFRAGTAAHLLRRAVTIEGDLIETTFRVVPGTPVIVERILDDHDDKFASAPGIHLTRCPVAHIDKDTGWVTGLEPQDCH